MDSEAVKQVEQVVTDGIASVNWIVLVTSLVAAGIGAYFGSYLRKKAEYRASAEHFNEILEQLKMQTKATERIKGDMARELEDFKARLQEDVYYRTEILHTQHIFVRELYADGIAEYSSRQAQALREAYLILFEPQSSSDSAVKGKDFEERVNTAIPLVMKPLREHLGLLDESTIKKVYSVRDDLLNFRKCQQEEADVEKGVFFDKTEEARKFVKADEIAFRLGLISQTLRGKETAQMKKFRVTEKAECGTVIIGERTLNKGTVFELEISRLSSVEMTDLLNNLEKECIEFVKKPPEAKA